MDHHADKIMLKCNVIVLENFDHEVLLSPRNTTKSKVQYAVLLESSRSALGGHLDFPASRGAEWKWSVTLLAAQSVSHSVKFTELAVQFLQVIT